MNNATPYKEKLRKGDYTKITEMLGGKYARATVEAQLKGTRTLKDDVKAAADLYIQTMNVLLKQNNTSNK